MKRAIKEQKSSIKKWLKRKAELACSVEIESFCTTPKFTFFAERLRNVNYKYSDVRRRTERRKVNLLKWIK